MPADPSLIISHQDATLHSFRKLPLELRRMIWRAALPGPRNVVIKPIYLKNPDYPIVQPGRNKKGSLKYYPPKRVMAFVSRRSLPSLFYTCRESLDVLRETYTLTFGSFGAMPRIWFNHELDTLIIPRITGWEISTCGDARLRELIHDLDQVKRLVRNRHWQYLLTPLGRRKRE